MNTILLVAALALTPQDGSLLFVENGNRLVQNHTDSTLSHVAIILKEKDEYWVYEATPPKVRKIPLTDYYAEVEKINSRKKKEKLKIWIANPDKPLTTTQKKAMKDYLEGEIDRKYGIGSYLSRKPGQTIHCGELTGFAFKLAGLGYSENPCADDPWDVWEQTKKTYTKRQEVKSE